MIEGSACIYRKEERRKRKEIRVRIELDFLGNIEEAKKIHYGQVGFELLVQSRWAFISRRRH